MYAYGSNGVVAEGITSAKTLDGTGASLLYFTHIADAERRSVYWDHRVWPRIPLLTAGGARSREHNAAFALFRAIVPC